MIWGWICSGCRSWTVYRIEVKLGMHIDNDIVTEGLRACFLNSTFPRFFSDLGESFVKVMFINKSFDIHLLKCFMNFCFVSGPEPSQRAVCAPTFTDWGCRTPQTARVRQAPTPQSMSCKTAPSTRTSGHSCGRTGQHLRENSGACNFNYSRQPTSISSAGLEIWQRHDGDRERRKRRRWHQLHCRILVQRSSPLSSLTKTDCSPLALTQGKLVHTYTVKLRLLTYHNYCKDRHWLDDLKWQTESFLLPNLVHKLDFLNFEHFSFNLTTLMIKAKCNLPEINRKGNKQSVLIGKKVVPHSFQLPLPPFS